MNKYYLSFLITLTLLLFLSGVPTSSAMADDPIVGSWEGKVSDQGVFLACSYSFSSVSSGTFDVPAYLCGGTLSGGLVDGVYSYTESVTYGGPTDTEPGCIGADVSFVIQEDTLYLEAPVEHEGQSWVVKGTFHRVTVPPAPQ